jgi:hypothetical protein
MAEFEGDLEAVGKLVKAAMTSRQPKKGKRSRKFKDARQIQADAIVAEMKGLDIGRTELPKNCIRGVVRIRADPGTASCARA